MSLDVVAFLLLGLEGRTQECDARGVAEVARDAQGTKESAENILLLSVKIDAEGLDILHRTERGLAVFGLEVVVVVGDVAYEVDAPPLVGPPVEIGLIVEKVGLVLTVGLQCAQEIAVGLVAQTVEPAHLLVGHAHVCVGPKQGCCQGSLKGILVAVGRLELFVGDVQGGRHLVTILCRVAARGKGYPFDHVGVDDRKPLLLSAADKERTINLHTVDVDGVLVERSAAHVILA